MPSRRLLMIDVAAAAALTASAAAAAPEACKLLSPAEVGAAVGAKMGPGEALNGSTTTSCKWLQQGVGAGSAVTVILSTNTAQAFEMGKAMHPTPVAGLGEEAYQAGNTLTYSVLRVKKGAASLTVTVRGLKDVAAVQAAERAVGKAALARL